MEPWGDWPPACEHEDHIITQALDWAQSHGLVYRPRPSGEGEPPSSSSCITAPISLYPSPFPRALFDEALRLQPLYNALYAHVTVDEPFLDRVIGGAVVLVDDFQRELYDIWKTVSREGIKQDLHLGLFRSDYLIHATAQPPAIKQVEFNTISSSFGALASRVSELHRYLLQSGQYPRHPLLDSLDKLPPNAALKALSAGLAAAHKAYNKPDSQILMVVQPNERNAFDQRPLEWELFERHGIKVLRYTFDELVQRASIDPSTSALRVKSTTTMTDEEVSVVYYRAGYTPTDYTSPAIWQLRLLIERSRAIKCPTVALQLAGAKKVQQVLAADGQLDAFLERGSTPSTLDNPPPKARLDLTDAAHLLSSFTSLYPLDDHTPEGRRGVELARREPKRFVMKPQREGGGNNVYRESIPPFLDELERKDASSLPASQRGEKRTTTTSGKEGYILMELIEPPAEAQNVMVKAGEANGVKAHVISELGIYGVCLFRQSSSSPAAPGDRGADILVNETAGYLLRTKARDSDEGGVAVGFSVIDSPLLY